MEGEHLGPFSLGETGAHAGRQGSHSPPRSSSEAAALGRTFMKLEPMGPWEP